MRCFIWLYMLGYSFSFCRSPEFHIQPQFEEVRPFHLGIAAVRQGNSWGFIDTSGQWIIPATFASAMLTDEKTYLVTDDAHRVFEIGKSPETGSWTALPYMPEYTPVETPSGTRFIFEQEGHFGIRDANGNVLTEPVYDSIDYLGGNLFTAWLVPRGACLLNADGKVLSDYMQEINPELQYGRIRFRNDDRYGLMAPDGRIILPASQWRLDIAGRHIACSQGGPLQLCTDRLEKLSELQFDEVVYLDEDHWLAKTTDSGRGTIFDATGHVVKSGIQLSDGIMMHGGFPAQDIGTGKWGYINSKGDAVIPFAFAYTESFGPDGKAVFWDADPSGRAKKGLLDTTGRIILPARFDAISRHPDGVYTVVQDGKFQFMDENLNALSKEISKPMEYIGHGVYAVYRETRLLKFNKSNWYTGEKGGFYFSREAKIAAVYSLDGSLLIDGKEVTENEPVPQLTEGFAPAKKNGKWGFVKCKDPD